MLTRAPRSAQALAWQDSFRMNFSGFPEISASTSARRFAKVPFQSLAGAVWLFALRFVESVAMSFDV